jgi:hypothetical protein
MTEPAKVIKTGHTHRTAPGELALVHAFLNTWHADGPRERLDSPERMRDWLAKRSLLPPGTRVSRKEYEAVRRLRDALRAATAAGGSATGQRGHEELNALVRNAPLFVSFDPFFFDTSKNHSAIWCSSQFCGNRMAARAYRARSA